MAGLFSVSNCGDSKPTVDSFIAEIQKLENPAALKDLKKAIRDHKYSSVIDDENSKGETPLVTAAGLMDDFVAASIVNALTSAGADPEKFGTSKDGHGKITPLMEAALHGNSKVVAKLLYPSSGSVKKADVNKLADGKTALYFALLKSPNFDVIYDLLNTGAKVTSEVQLLLPKVNFKQSVEEFKKLAA